MRAQSRNLLEILLIRFRESLGPSVRVWHCVLPLVLFCRSYLVRPLDCT